MSSVLTNSSSFVFFPTLCSIPVQEGSRILYSRSCTIETIMDSLLMDFEELERSSHSLVRQLSATESSVRETCVLLLIIWFAKLYVLVLFLLIGCTSVGSFS